MYPESIPRRDALRSLGVSLGSLALTDPFACEAARTEFPLSPKPPMLPAKAKAVIMLIMEGGPGHMDTFDPKPELQRLHNTTSNSTRGPESGFKSFVGSPFKFRKVGQNGIDMCDQWQHIAAREVADELCNFRGCTAESLNHPEALYHINTGNRISGDPAIGSWMTYGLGSKNQDLPGYVVMTELAMPQGGSMNWTNGYLPAHFQGTRLRPVHQERISPMANDKLVLRMPGEVPLMIDIEGESEKTRHMYGLDNNDTAAFGHQCLMARRLVENGVRFVQIFNGGWDSHDYLDRGHASRIRSVDKPMAALIKDLKARGMLDETLVIWTGEFGRTPDNDQRDGVHSIGRGHNADAMAMLLAGGGVQPGIVGATDEIGAAAVECVHPIRDLHVTLLHLMGLDDNKLTYFDDGICKRHSQCGGEIIHELIA